MESADLGRQLGATRPIATSQVTLFLPSVDREGSPIDQEQWRDEALAVFGDLFRGGTAFPPGRGVWRDDDRGGALVFDDTVMLTSYVEPALLDNEVVVERLRAFLHRLGREGHQGEVAIVVDDDFISISEFDPSTEEESDG